MSGYAQRHLSPAERAEALAHDRRLAAARALEDQQPIEAVAHALLAIEAQLEVLQLIAADR